MDKQLYLLQSAWIGVVNYKYMEILSFNSSHISLIKNKFKIPTNVLCSKIDSTYLYIIYTYHTLIIIGLSNDIGK
jgi:hypothetical protein